MAIDENTIRSLLIRNKISDYKLEQIRSDASFREYYRVLDKNLLIMYAPKDKGESLVNFEKINNVLSSINLFVKCRPTNPHPPVIKIFFILLYLDNLLSFLMRYHLHKY